MIYSIRIDGVQRQPVTLEELGALIDRREFKPGDSLIGPGLPQWVTGADASAYLRRLFGERLPPEFGTFAPPPRRHAPAVDGEQSGCMIAAKVLAVIMAIAIALVAALILLLYGLCGGFR
jgi:hypothetical protein